ncbi:MAG: ArsR/SmtB family transcription factor [Actinomycetota bacterium]
MTDFVTGVCRALAHPVRRALLQSLSAGECDVGHLCAGSDLDQPTVSKHLAALRRAGLVQARVDGPRRCYSLLHEDTVRRLLELLDELEARFEEDTTANSR